MNHRRTDSAEEGLLQFFYLCPIGILEIDATGYIHRINPRATQWLMPLDKPAILENIFQILAPFDQQLKLSVQTSIPPRSRILEHHRVIVRHDGRQTHLEFSAYRISDVRFMLVFSDVTVLALAEASVRTSEARLRAVLDNAADYIYRFNYRTGEYEYLSANVEKILGYSPAEIKAMGFDSMFALVHVDDQLMVRVAIDEAARSGQSQVNFRKRAKGGQYLWLSAQMWVTTDAASMPVYRDVNVRELTALERSAL